MKTKIICHMAVSIDGKIILDNWTPEDAVPLGLFESLYDEIEADAWLIGRVSAEFYASKTPLIVKTDKKHPRTSWFATSLNARCRCIVLDPNGKLSWDTPTADGSSIIVVLTESVSDACLEALRISGVSYIFGGRDEIDLKRMLKILSDEAGINTILLQGGAITNGSFLEQGLIDEISMVISPVLDGSAKTPGILSVNKVGLHHIECISLEGISKLEGESVWLRYKLTYS